MGPWCWRLVQSEISFVSSREARGRQQRVRFFSRHLLSFQMPLSRPLASACLSRGGPSSARGFCSLGPDAARKLLLVNALTKYRRSARGKASEGRSNSATCFFGLSYLFTCNFAPTQSSVQLRTLVSPIGNMVHRPHGAKSQCGWGEAMLIPGKTSWWYLKGTSVNGWPGCRVCFSPVTTHLKVTGPLSPGPLFCPFSSLLSLPPVKDHFLITVGLFVSFSL